jgi:RNA polymerase sigma-70 factor (ECF subfamily)
VSTARPKEGAEVDELDLALRCAKGDESAHRAAFAYLRGAVHRTLFRIMGDNRYTKDLAQDAFLEIFRSIGSFRGDSSLRTWADVIAARAAYRYLSSRPPRAVHLELVPEPEADVPSPDAHAHAREAARRLYAILDRLEPKYRIAYALHVIDGRALREVAQITRVSLIAAKNRVWRARRMVDERARRDPWLRIFLERAEASS